MPLDLENIHRLLKPLYNKPRKKDPMLSFLPLARAVVTTLCSFIIPLAGTQAIYIHSQQRRKSQCSYAETSTILLHSLDMNLL